MTEQVAIDALNNLRYMYTNNTPKKIWYTRAESDFERIFGKESTPLKRLRYLYEYGWGNEQENWDLFIATYQGHIQKLGLPREKEIIVDPDTITLGQLWRIFISMPLKHIIGLISIVVATIIFVFGAGIKWEKFTTKPPTYNNNVQYDTLKVSIERLLTQLAKNQQPYPVVSIKKDTITIVDTTKKVK